MNAVISLRAQKKVYCKMFCNYVSVVSVKLHVINRGHLISEERDRLKIAAAFALNSCSAPSVVTT